VAAVIDEAKLGVGRKDYYLREVAKDREVYLTGHGEASGRWYGAAAVEAFGLSGEITAEQFRRVFTGHDRAAGSCWGGGTVKTASSPTIRLTLWTRPAG
jgi:hypothetical protein